MHTDSRNRVPARRRITLKGVVLAGLALLLAALLIGTLVWMGMAREPTSEALASLESDEVVAVTLQPGMIVFEPAGGGAITGFILYPGAGVDFRSYAPVLRRIAARGYTAIVLEMPLNLAFFDMDAADEAMKRYPDIENWVVGGHSLGGVAAANYAASHATVSGLVLWASYPGSDALKDAEFPVLSIYGSEDGLTTIEDIEASRARLPADAQFVEIPGGNHAQFGSYGSQPGDSTASITAEEQWEQIVGAAVMFLEEALE